MKLCILHSKFCQWKTSKHFTNFHKIQTLFVPKCSEAPRAYTNHCIHCHTPGSLFSCIISTPAQISQADHKSRRQQVPFLKSLLQLNQHLDPGLSAESRYLNHWDSCQLVGERSPPEFGSYPQNNSMYIYYHNLMKPCNELGSLCFISTENFATYFNINYAKHESFNINYITLFTAHMVSSHTNLHQWSYSGTQVYLIDLNYVSFDKLAQWPMLLHTME